MRLLSAFLFVLSGTLASAATQVISSTSPLVHLHGRWDDLPSTWWPGSGFKLSFLHPPTLLTLNIGSKASNPPIIVSARFGDKGEWVTLNLTAGANSIPLISVGLIDPGTQVRPLVLDVVTQFEVGNARMELESVEVDSAAILTKYTPKKLAFEFIGDSLTAGFLSERGVVDDFSFKVGDYFNAEHNQIAQSGACLTDVNCFAPRGMSFLYFQTQNSAFTFLNNNITTPWDFSKSIPPTHVFINLGTNDKSFLINGTAFENQYLSFLAHLRTLYRTQPIFIMSPWGFPFAPGQVAPYFQEEDRAVIDTVRVHDKNVFLINGTGWIEFGDTFPDFTHPTPNGHSKIAFHLIDFLLRFGVRVGS